MTFLSSSPTTPGRQSSGFVIRIRAFFDLARSPPDLQLFTLSKSLILGLSYPYDWGFIPSTKGEDGDPIDALILHDAATSPGLVLKCKIIGVLEVLQTEGGKHAILNRLVRPAQGGRQKMTRRIGGCEASRQTAHRIIRPSSLDGASLWPASIFMFDQMAGCLTSLPLFMAS